MPHYVTTERFEQALDELNERIDRMATQAEVDALTQAVDQVATDLAAARTSLQTEIDNLAAANPAINLSALQAAVTPLDSAVQALGALIPEPPAPAAP